MAKKGTRAMIVYNPRSGRGNTDISPALAVLREEGWDIAIREKQQNGDGTTLARKAVKQGCDVVIASGGDGTVNEVMAGLLGSGVALGVLPIGTMNLWAAEMGFASRLDVVARQIVLAERQRVDVGRVSINGQFTTHFLLIAGLGADAAVLDRTSRTLKNRIGSLAVGLAMAEALPALDVVPVRARIDGLPWHGYSGQIIVGNSRRYGGFTNVTGHAYIDDGLLDVCIFTVSNLLDVARQAGSLLLRQQPDPSSAEIYRASSVTITTLRPLPLEVDGSVVDKHLDKHSSDAYKPTEYRFGVVPRGLCALVPRTYTGQLFQPTPLTTTFALGDVVPVGDGKRGDASGNGNHHHHHHHEHHEHHEHHGDHHQHGHRDDKGGLAPGQKRMRVLAVGVDSVIAQKLPSGRTVTVELGPHTRTAGGDGTAMHGLAEGDIIGVEGKKDRDTGTIAAKRITLLEVPAEQP